MKNRERELQLKQLQLNPVNFKYKQAIGVEIECFSDTFIPENKIPHWVRQDTDGSIEVEDCDNQAEAEFRILSPTYYVDSRIRRFCGLLKKYNYQTNYSCGLHVHFDMRGKTFPQVVRLGQKIDNWLYKLQYLVEPDRRDGEWSNFGIDEENKYQAVNVYSFKYHSTLEIRLLEGTTNEKKITNWIKLIQAIMKARYRQPKSSNCLGALRELPLKKEVKKYWTNRYHALQSKYNHDEQTQKVF